MSEPTFTIGLDDLKDLADAICDLDSYRPGGNDRAIDLVARGHSIIHRVLGDQAHLVYAPSDDSEEEVAA